MDEETLTSLKMMCRNMIESGLLDEMARMFAATVKALEQEGFSRDEAIQIALSDKYAVKAG